MRVIRRLHRALQQVVYFLKTGYIETTERVNPDFPTENFINHFKVYKFAAQFVAGKHVLDVGCGTGYGSDYLSQTAASVIGIDISKAAIKRAKRYTRPVFYVMDAHHLQFPDATFDFIISTENFEHLTDQRRHLLELRRVLKLNGMCLIATPNPEQFTTRNPYHTKENTFQELCELLPVAFKEFEIVENQLPHNLNRPHGILPTSEPLLIFGNVVDKGHLSNTHSFFCFCR
jgi:2-polyprenyl-3-methyl-5-hydroxy-6-metoxy-1,4-benzoquinol methylase